MPRHPDCQIGDDPVGAVFRDQGNVRALRKLPGAQPVRSATSLLANVAPGEGLHLAPANGLNQISLARVSRFTFEEELQRQTNSDGHGTRSFVVRP